MENVCKLLINKGHVQNEALQNPKVKQYLRNIDKLDVMAIPGCQLD